MRMNKTKHERRNVLIFYQIPLTYSLRKCIEISLENLYMDIGMKELSLSFITTVCRQYKFFSFVRLFQSSG